MLLKTSVNPATVWEVPAQFKGIYTHAVLAKGVSTTLYISGQFGVDVAGHTPESFPDQARNAIANVQALLVAAGLPLSSLVKLTYYVTNIDHLPALMEVRRGLGLAEPPSVTVLVVSALANPKYLVEVEAVAVA